MKDYRGTSGTLSQENAHRAPQLPDNVHELVGTMVEVLDVAITSEKGKQLMKQSQDSVMEIVQETWQDHLRPPRS